MSEPLVLITEADAYIKEDNTTLEQSSDDEGLDNILSVPRQNLFQLVDSQYQEALQLDDLNLSDSIKAVLSQPKNEIIVNFGD